VANRHTLLRPRSQPSISAWWACIGTLFTALNAAIPLEFSAVLAKGRGNYASLRRYSVAKERAGNLLAKEEDIRQLAEVGEWLKSYLLREARGVPVSSSAPVKRRNPVLPVTM
jgi:hypothetical protein